MERSSREIALQFAVSYTQGRHDETDMFDDPMLGKSPRYIPPTPEEQILNAEKYLTFLEGDEVV